MIKIPKRLQNLLILIFGIFIFFFVALLIISSPARQSKGLDGYAQLIENAAIPIFLAGQEQQASLELGALIQNTPIRQIRIYDASNDLMLRIQNTAPASSSDEPSTLGRQVSFENSFVGTLELDIELLTNTGNTSPLYLSFITALAFTTLVSVLLMAALYYPELFKLNVKVTTNLTESPKKKQQSVLSTDRFPSEPNILVLVRIQSTQDKQGDGESPGSQHSEVATLVDELAGIYGAQCVATASDTLIFTITGRANTQNIQQSLVLCWGLTQLENEAESRKITPCIQTYAVNSEDISTPTENFQDYWKELDSRCPESNSVSAFVGKSLASKVDQAAFELTQKNSEFMEVIEAAPSIKNLWKNQRTKRHF